MAQQTELEVTPRTVLGKANKRLRKAGIIPAHLFGRKEASQAIQLNAVTLEHFLRKHAATNIVLLKLPDNTTQTALIRHIQHDPVTDKVLHVDFFRIAMGERVKVKLPLRFVGEAPAVKDAGGVLLHLLDTLEVECQASDLVEHIDVNISSLAEIDDILHAKDIALPPNYTLLTDPDESVVKVGATRAELAEEAVTETKAETTKVETTKAETESRSAE
jgi:large subunit ribosomal protein L25